MPKEYYLCPREYNKQQSHCYHKLDSRKVKHGEFGGENPLADGNIFFKCCNCGLITQ